MDPLIHPLVRLKICGFLSAARQTDFSELRDLLGISDSSLSKHLTALSSADYVRLSHRTSGGRRRVVVHLTAQGKSAFLKHVEAIRDLVNPANDG